MYAKLIATSYVIRPPELALSSFNVSKASSVKSLAFEILYAQIRLDWGPHISSSNVVGFSWKFQSSLLNLINLTGVAVLFISLSIFPFKIQVNVEWVLIIICVSPFFFWSIITLFEKLKTSVFKSYLYYILKSHLIASVG